NREGFGNILAEGSERAAEIVGKDAQKIVLNVKKLELPAHDPRGFLAMAINYATGQRGACHQRGFVLQDESSIPEWGISENQEIYSIKEPVIATARYQDWAEIFNSLIQCEYMTSGGLTLNDQITLLNYVTGWNLEASDMLKIGERIFTLQRLINIRFGVSRKDDTLPLRIFEPLKEGVNAGKIPATFEKALKEYYEFRGWDNDGKPTVKKLAELNLTKTLTYKV
ncbi:MAG: aldehyde ferredoxin oxidoreductase C-terminal domain-containing protein, partial [Candidatus Heimdallarchaeaceae archaeon]